VTAGDRPQPAAPGKVDLAEKLSRIQEYWTPRRVGHVSGCDVKLAKLKGDFVWHRHDAEDELFLVLKGRLLLQFRDREEWIGPGELIIVPRGVEHRPVAAEEVHLLLVEPASTLNTGNVRNERTLDVIEEL
jgi:mannose-6-phosphate isomerase-like protein (cupin superfamily)